MPNFETYFNTSHLPKRFWINFTVTLFQVFNYTNFLVLSIWNWVKINWILKFFFFFINTSLQCLCMLIRVVVQFYLSQKQWNWIIPPSLFHLWMIISFFIKILRHFISVVISRIFKILILRYLTTSCKILMISLSSSWFTPILSWSSLNSWFLNNSSARSTLTKELSLSYFCFLHEFDYLKS